MKSSPRIRITMPFIAVALFSSAIWLPLSSAAPGRAGTSIGVGAIGQHAFEYMGKIDQSGGDFTSYGYLTYVRGLPDSVLFTDPIHHTEATARFTFYAPGKLTARSVLGTLFELSSSGSLTIYASAAGGATFANPSSFQHGTRVASLALRQQSIVNVQAPNQGILTILGEGSQLTSQTFTLLGNTYRMGRVGLQEQMTDVGQGTRLEPTAPRATFNIAGSAAVGGDITG